jgi:signal transduction histidine kinase
MAGGAAAVFALALALHVFLVDAEKRHLLEREEQAARTLAASMSLPFTQILLYEETGLVAEAGLLDLYVSRMVGDGNMQVTYAMVLDPDGLVLSHSDLTQYHKRLADPVSRKGLAVTAVTLSPVGDPFEGGVIDVAAPLNVSSKRLGTLRFGYSLSGLKEKVSGLKRKAVALTISSAALMIVFVFVTGRAMARPVRRLADALNAVDLGNLDPVPLPKRNDEIGELQESYRIMMIRLREEELERKKTQEMLGSTEKMATIGTLAAGIAHEINSPLTGAMHSVRALSKETLTPQKRDQYLRVVGESLDRIRRAVSQMLDYSTVHAVNVSDCDLSRIVGKTLELLEYQIGRNGIEVENRLPTLNVRADAHRIEQVFVNLVLNAIAAMPSGGRLEIRHVDDGSSLTIAVADTGEGIPEANIERIFEPFFTTKGTGKGTGLGLAVCRKIVEQHGGKISVSSRPGEGATFFVSLPHSSVP